MSGPSVEELLAESQRRGFLGPGPLEPHVAHALALCDGIPDGSRVLDLGAGGGLPGVVAAGAHPHAQFVLLDSMRRRTEFLEWAVGVSTHLDNVEVVTARAETLAQDSAHRGAYDVVVARSFGPPAATAECGAPFLRCGGVLIVSEPPDRSIDRWPSEGLALLGLAPAEIESSPVARALMRQTASCPVAYPRRDGVPARRPLF